MNYDENDRENVHKRMFVRLGKTMVAISSGRLTPTLPRHHREEVATNGAPA
jgi:hypothetical protein